MNLAPGSYIEWPCRHCGKAIPGSDGAMVDDPSSFPWIVYHERCVVEIARSDGRLLRLDIEAFKEEMASRGWIPYAEVQDRKSSLDVRLKKLLEELAEATVAMKELESQIRAGNTRHRRASVRARRTR